MRTKLFILEAVAIPWLAAATLLITRWGMQNLVFVLGVPLFVLVWRMWVLSQRREAMTQRDVAAHAGLASWHALGVLACLFLMCFEAGVAICAEARVTDGLAWLLFVALTYMPFLFISTVAEWSLARARRLAQRTQSASNL